MKKGLIWTLIIIGLIVYLNLGYVCAYYIDYANYYPNSAVAHFVYPTPPWIRSDAKVNSDGTKPNLAERYKTFNEYYERDGITGAILNCMPAPIIQVIIYVFVAIEWIVQLIVWALVWCWDITFGGGIAKIFNLIPK